jgi:hypothetical protein
MNRGWKYNRCMEVNMEFRSVPAPCRRRLWWSTATANATANATTRMRGMGGILIWVSLWILLLLQHPHHRRPTWTVVTVAADNIHDQLSKIRGQIANEKRKNENAQSSTKSRGTGTTTSASATATTATATAPATTTTTTTPSPRISYKDIEENPQLLTALDNMRYQIEMARQAQISAKRALAVISGVDPDQEIAASSSLSLPPLPDDMCDPLDRFPTLKRFQEKRKLEQQQQQLIKHNTKTSNQPTTSDNNRDEL